VVLVIDASKASRSVGAMALGFKHFDPTLHLAGVILNGIAGDLHLELARPSLDRAGIRYLGYMPGRQEFTLPERHLGLVPTAEGRVAAAYYQHLSTQAAATVDLDGLLAVAADLAVPSIPACTLFPAVSVAPKAAIALAMDQAFNFYYPDSLDLLSAWGAELVPFRLLEDTVLPPHASGVYIGGGFPEMFAEPLAANVGMLRDLVAPAEVWAVVKADGYGHGASAVGGAALAAGATRLCVATWEEARALRDALPEAPVLVMSPLAPGEEADLAGVELAVSSVESFARLRAAAREPVGVHVKVDTGMGRWGMAEDEARRVVDEIGGSSLLRLSGLMSHLSSADDDADHTREQLERFRQFAEGLPDCPRHVANSAGALGYPEARFDAVRCGIAIYGLSPFGDDSAARGLAPALRLESYVAQLKLIEPGEGTGYGRRFVAERPTWIGLVPAGYADGVPRLLSGRMDVLVRGRRRRVAATISMDQLTFVVGEQCDVELGDRVVLIGSDGGERIGAEEWAARSDTIAYEIVCDIAPRRRRVEHVIVDG